MPYAKTRTHNFKRAQVSLEVVLLIAAVMCALIVMQAYFRRGLSGRIKTSVDAGLGKPFDPYKGKFVSESVTQGDTASLTKYATGEELGADEVYADKLFPVSYSVYGPNAFVDSDGSIPIANSTESTDVYFNEDWGTEYGKRIPFTTSSYTKSEIEWER